MIYELNLLCTYKRARCFRRTYVLIFLFICLCRFLLRLDNISLLRWFSFLFCLFWWLGFRSYLLDLTFELIIRVFRRGILILLIVIIRWYRWNTRLDYGYVTLLFNWWFWLSELWFTLFLIYGLLLFWLGWLFWYSLLLYRFGLPLVWFCLLGWLSLIYIRLRLTYLRPVKWFDIFFLFVIF